MDMKDISSTTFGYVIAFLLPGLVSLYGLAFFSSRVEKILQPATTTDATIGPSFLLLLAALAAGLFQSAIRCFVFEKWVCRNRKLDPGMFARLAAADRLASFKAVVDEHYRYHQFYGGCFLALIVVFTGWLWNTYRTLNWRYLLLAVVVFVAFEILVYFTSTDAYCKYVDRGNTIVRGLPEVQKGASAECQTGG